MKAFLAALAVLAPAATGRAQYIDARFVGGSVLASGSAIDPAVANTPALAAAPGLVLEFAASGSGSTSSGLVGGAASMQAQIVRGDRVTSVRFTGTADTFNGGAAAGAAASIAVRSRDALARTDPLIVSVAEPTRFEVFDRSVGIASVGFAGQTGVVTGDLLTPGTYLLTFEVAANIIDFPANHLSRLDWTLVLRRPGDCAADFDSGGAANVVDIFAYLTAWFAGDARADFDGSGGAPTVLDIFAFLGAWFRGCP